jgi:hypothetical protein
MLRRLTRILIFLAAVALPAAALRPHPRMLPPVVHNSALVKPPLSTPEAPSWVAPALRLVSSLMFLFGAVPGIIARNKEMPNWKSILFSGIFFGFLFFPIALFQLYKVLGYEKPPVMDQASFRPANHVQVVAQTQDVTVR